jgi:hypothetical protein
MEKGRYTFGGNGYWWKRERSTFGENEHRLKRYIEKYKKQ